MPPTYRTKIPDRISYAGNVREKAVLEALRKMAEQAECVSFGPADCADPEHPTPAEVCCLQLIAVLKSAGIMADSLTDEGAA